jgi:hypothetical protein
MSNCYYNPKFDRCCAHMLVVRSTVMAEWLSAWLRHGDVHGYVESHLYGSDVHSSGRVSKTKINNQKTNQKKDNQFSILSQSHFPKITNQPHHLSPITANPVPIFLSLSMRFIEQSFTRFNQTSVSIVRLRVDWSHTQSTAKRENNPGKKGTCYIYRYR